MEDIQNYHDALEVKLMEMKDDGKTCSNPRCNDINHKKEIDSNVLAVLMGIVEASYCNIPIVGKYERQVNQNRKMMPNWEEEVKPFRSDTIY